MTNISKDYVSFVKKNIYSYIKLIMGNYFDKAIFDALLDTYINVRYYNMYESKYKDPVSNINYYLKSRVSKLMVDNNNYQNVIKEMDRLFKYIYYLDDVKKCDNLRLMILEIDKYRVNNLGINDGDFILKFSNLVKSNEKRKKKYLQEIDSDKFVIREIKTNNKRVSFCELEYDIKFPKIYSEYAISRVYNKGIINEDRLFITYYLVTGKILKNVKSLDYDKDYIVEFPLSIFSKEDKFNRLIKIIDSEMIRNNIVISITYTEYLEYKDYIDEFIGKGYKIAVIIDDKFDYKERSMIWINVFSYIITDSMIGSIPRDKIIIRK